MTSLPIAIVGAGVAGLAAALSLSKAGLRAEIFEKAEELKAIGAGIQLSPNALRVLDRIGILPRLAASSVAADAVTLRAAGSGRALARVPARSSDGTGYLAVHRADLQSALLDAVRTDPAIRLHLGTELVSFEHVDGETVLCLRDRAGGKDTTSRASLLVGADGVRSAVARSLGRPPARDTGFVAARYSLDPSRLPGAGVEGIEAWLGPRRHAVVYPLRAGSQVSIVLITPAERDETAIAGGFARWDKRLRSLIREAEFKGTWPLFECEPDRPLTYGDATCLIGDAGHAMLPFAAQGAAMGIEDGHVLARHLKTGGDRADALRAFEAERRPRLERVRRRVAFHRLVYHLPAPFAFGRNAVLAVRSPQALRADLDWLYDWRP